MPSAAWTDSASSRIVHGVVPPRLMISPRASGVIIARTMPSTVSATYVKVRVCWPSPWMSISSPSSRRSMKADCGPPHQLGWLRGP